MEKKKITIDEAQAEMFKKLANEEMGDRIYEFAQDLYQKHITQIEYANEIVDKDCLDQNEEWYDEIYENYFQKVYDTMIDYLTAKY